MDFVESYNLFLNFLDRIPLRTSSSNADPFQRIAFLVTPWMFTQVPWYSLTLALLCHNSGRDVCFIWDDLLFNDAHATGFQNKIIGTVLERLNIAIPYYRLSEMPALNPVPEDDLEIERLSRANAIWAIRSSVPSSKMDYLRNHFATSLKRNLPHIQGLFKMIKMDHMIIPGGIYGNTGLLLRMGRKVGVRTATYDAGFGAMLIGVDDVAAHQMDIPKLLKPDSFIYKNGIKEQAIEIALEEFRLRKEGKDVASSQAQAYSMTDLQIPCDVLIPINLEWDAAQLDKFLFFEDDCHWLTETINFLLNNSTAVIVVRQHPADRFHGNTGRKLAAHLSQVFHDNARFRFISCDESVNTYKLIETATLVLPSTSTTGIEAAMLGKPVVVCTNVYYSKLSFVQCVASKEAYFEKIKHTLIDKPQATYQVIEEAALCYFLMFSNRIYTDFTPQPTDYSKWISKPFDALVADRKATTILNSLNQKIPASLLNSSAKLRIDMEKLTNEY
ncbi:MAG: hypothetical protein ACOYVJ_02395 [Nitrospirota bacterium]